MTVQEFNQLNECFRAQMLWLEGTPLHLTRFTPATYCVLYLVYDFYAEIHFDRRTREPLYISAFTDVDRLDPYLTGIDISDIFQKGDLCT
ncbi:MAG TPA: hypothetical protein VFZ78_13480 [Flavisolibacter sp.]